MYVYIYIFTCDVYYIYIIVYTASSKQSSINPGQVWFSTRSLTLVNNEQQSSSTSDWKVLAGFDSPVRQIVQSSQDNQPYTPVDGKWTEMKYKFGGRLDAYMMVLVAASFKPESESIYRSQPDFIKTEWRILCLQASLSCHSLVDSPRFFPQVIQLDLNTLVAMEAADEIM